jgi:hypothetical protein
LARLPAGCGSSVRMSRSYSGGGTLLANDGEFRERVVAGVAAELPRAQVRLLDLPPVFGALVEALRRAGAAAGSLGRARRALGS